MKEDKQTIAELRKKNLWPFPEWKDGKMVVIKKRQPKGYKFKYLDDLEQAPF